MADETPAPRRARKIRSITEITESAPSVATIADPAEGVVFINNYLNREFVLPNQSKFKFTQSRQYFSDPAQIAHLRKLIEESVNSRIFEEKPEASTEEPAIEQEPEAGTVDADPILDPIEPAPEPPATE